MHLVFLERFPSPQDAESDFQGGLGACDVMVYWLPRLRVTEYLLGSQVANVSALSFTHNNSLSEATVSGREARKPHFGLC